MDIFSIYNRMPIFAQNLMLNCYGMKLIKQRYNKRFFDLVKVIDKRETYDADKMKTIQMKMLSRVINHAYNHVLYYHDFMDSNGIKPSDIKTVDDIKKFSIIDKQFVKSNSERFISDNNNKVVDYYTGGTTGSPFIIKTTNDEIIYNFAIYETRCKHRFSIKWGDESAVFLGKKIVPLSDRSGIYWRRASSIHQTFFSIYHMNNQTMGLYIRRLRELAPVFITGYVTPVYELARYIKDNNIEKLNIKAAFLSSETLLDDQKQVIEDSLGCQVCNGYSQAEGVAFISTSRDSLHISPDFGLVEFIPTEKQDIYEIIGTSLFNKTMPLIRYNTHDYVIIKDFNKLDKWGEPIIDSIIGREDGVIKTKDSRVISAASLSLVFSDLPLIERIQIIQEALDKVTVLVVSKYASNSTELNTLQKRISEILGQDFEVSLKCVDEIEKASNGKSRMIVSKI